VAEISKEDANRLRELGRIWEMQRGANAHELDELANLAIKVGNIVLDGDEHACPDCGRATSITDGHRVCQVCGYSSATRVIE